jgi:hypothetical protein
VRSEELQVVAEELRVQKEQVAVLLRQHETEVRWRSHLSALVSLGLAVTDGNPARRLYEDLGFRHLVTSFTVRVP